MKTLSIIWQKSRLVLRNYWCKNIWHKLVCGLLALFIILSGLMFGIAQWYTYSQRHQPLRLGVSFIPAYAEALGLDAKETMDALLDIGVRNFRVVSYWNQMETIQGQYDFHQLDWQFKKAEAAKADVILTLGLRQPRWPECHTPAWATQMPRSEWQPRLEKFITAVVERYQASPSLASYQLENEYFLKGFGTCTDFSRDRLVSEYKLVKKLDPARKIIVGRSNNALGFPVGQPQPDEFSISIYKRVWDAGVTHRYVEYPYPDWFYGFLAGAQKLFLGKNMVIGELQAEAWAPNARPLTEASLAEQNKSLNAERLKDRFSYGKGTGMREIYLWGAEYWYYRLKILHDPSLWDVARQEFTAKQ